VSSFPRATEVQTLLFDKSLFNAQGAKHWAKKHGFLYGSVDETESNFRLRQFSPTSAERGSFRTIRLRDGVQAVIAMPKVRKNPSVDVHFHRAQELVERAENMRDVLRKTALLGAAAQEAYWLMSSDDKDMRNLGTQIHDHVQEELEFIFSEYEEV
jgi:hypothetical protein